MGRWTHVSNLLGQKKAKSVNSEDTCSYNQLDKQATSTDAAGRVTMSVYDYNGNQIETDYPDGTVSRTVYDALSRSLYVQDRTTTNGSGVSVAPATLNRYDASGRVIRVDKYDSVTLSETTATGDYTPLGTPAAQCKLVVSSVGNVLNSTLTFYDALGDVQYTVSPRGLVTQKQYDANNRETNTLVFPAYCYWTSQGTGTPTPTSVAQSTSYTFDADGNQRTVADAANHTTTSWYDPSDRLIEVDEPAADGIVSQFTYYDSLGRKIQQTDEAGVDTTYSYDFRGLLTSVTLAATTSQQATTVYQYDELGNEVAQTDAAGRTTTFGYDALGHRIGRILPGGQSESFGYDLEGNQIYQTNFNGVIITNFYDLANRLTNQVSVNGFVVAYAFNPEGWRTNEVDGSGQTAYFYDAMGQMTNKVVTWTSGPVRSLNYGYDACGTVTNLYSGYYGGVSNAFAYDLLGRLTNVVANGGAAAGYGFDVVGNLQSLAYGNGVTNLCQYDAMNRLTNQAWNLHGTPLAAFAYILGPTGNRTALAETNNGTVRSYAWAYDSMYRLTQETLTGGTSGRLNYGYDVVGNRTSRTSSLSVLTNQSFVYTANDWLTNDAYDSNGNTTNSSGNRYQYDALNHATNVNNGSILIAYDGDGNRARKTVTATGTTTYYLLDDRNPSGYVQVLEEWTAASGTTNLNRVYNYGMDLISQRMPGSDTNYFIFDGHGSTRVLTDIGGNAQNAFAYDAYGSLIASNTTSQTAYLYCGQQFDSDLGMYLNRARYMSQNTGRFWTMDTAEGDNEPLSLHKYMYCEANPANRTDQSGHDSFDLGGMSFDSNTPNLEAGILSAVGLTQGPRVYNVTDKDLEVELASVYKRLPRVTIGGYALQDGDTDTKYYLDPDNRNSAFYWYWRYTGSEFSGINGLVMTGHELNYIGTGYAFGVYGYPRYQATAFAKLWMRKQGGTNKANALAATLAGYDYYHKK